MDPKVDVPRYEEYGLRSLLRVAEGEDWFRAHFGAALISGARLLEDPTLSDPGRAALRDALERLEAGLESWLAPGPLPRTPGASVEPLFAALDSGIGTLRRSGHDTIYLVAALRALERAPQLASARLVAALLQLHAATRDDDPARYLGYPDYHDLQVEPEDGIEPYSNVAEAVHASFEELRIVTPDIERDGRRYFLAGEKLHLVTHAHALWCLERMGRSDLARKGLAAQRLAVKLTRYPEGTPVELPVPSVLGPDDARFWQHEGGDALHKLKLAQASRELLQQFRPAERCAALTDLGRLWTVLGV